MSWAKSSEQLIYVSISGNILLWQQVLTVDINSSLAKWLNLLLCAFCYSNSKVLEMIHSHPQPSVDVDQMSVLLKLIKL